MRNYSRSPSTSDATSSPIPTRLAFEDSPSRSSPELARLLTREKAVELQALPSQMYGKDEPGPTEDVGVIDVIPPSVHLRELLDILIGAKYLLIRSANSIIRNEIKYRLHEFINERQIYFAKAPHKIVATDREGKNYF